MESVAYIDAAGRLDVGGITDPVPWWSFGKTVLAMAALRLVEQGALSLRDPVGDEGYCLAHLLRHEAGLPDYGALGAYHDDVAAGKPPWPVERLWAVLDAGRLRYPPGQGWAYSNIGYVRVGELISRAAGLPLAAALGRIVFAPLGLVSVRLALNPADLAGVRMGDAGGYHPGWVYPGLLTGTTADAARLLRALRAGELLAPASWAMMLEARPLPQYASAIHADPAYGLGLMLSAHDPLDHPLGHEGAGPGSGIAVYGQSGATCALWSAALSADAIAGRVFARLAGRGL